MIVELEDIVDAVNVSRSVRNPWGTILRRRYRPQLVISILIPIFQQWVGINAIIFYAPRESCRHLTSQSRPLVLGGSQL